MFERFICMAKARRALAEGRFADAIRLAMDPRIVDDRRAEEIRQSAQEQLHQRAQARLGRGEATLALRDLDAARLGGQDSRAALCQQDALLAQQQKRDSLQAARAQLVAGRGHAEAGRLALAEASLAAAAGRTELSPQAQALQALVSVRRAEARRLVESALEQGAAGAWDAAVGLAQAACGRDEAALAAGQVHQIVRGQCATILASLGQGQDLVAAVEKARRLVAALPAAVAFPECLELGQRLEAAALRAMAPGRAPAELLLAVSAGPLPGQVGEACEAAQLLQALPGLQDGGGSRDLAAAWARLADLLDDPGCRREAEGLAARLDAADGTLKAANERIVAGDLDAARQLAAKVLAEFPSHGPATLLRDEIEAQAAERESVLTAARAALAAGRLLAARRMLQAAAGGPSGAAATGLLAQAEAQMAQVERGLAQVRGELHAAVAKGAPAVVRLQERVADLLRRHADQPELPPLQQALAAGHAALCALERVPELLAAEDDAGLAQALAALAATTTAQPTATPGTMDKGPLDAAPLDAAPLAAALHGKGLAAAELALAGAEAAAAAGRLSRAEQLSRALEPLGAWLAALRGRLEGLEGRLASGREAAELQVQRGQQLLAAGDLEGAEAACAAARAAWIDGAGVRRFEDEVRATCAGGARLDACAELARRGDHEAADAALQEVQRPGALLRTRIYDMKKRLMQAQGLGDGYLLRVDEGGEFLALRGEAVTIGNLRDGRADLPILAALSARHARIERSMSFHGGMQDTLVAENGDVFVGGQRKLRHLLQSGDRVQLGPSLHCSYRVPSRRSLTAELRLHGGIQAGGTDRILLQKDRGRDGRILIGPGDDVHVRVGSGQGEVEVYSDKAGRLLVRCDAGGTIDGAPFQGEQALVAGAVVVANGITLVAVPFRPGR